MSIVQSAGAPLTLLLWSALASSPVAQDARAGAAEPAAALPAAALPAETPPAGTRPAGAAPAEVASPLPDAQPAAQQPTAYARIEQSDTPLRCFPTSYSPVYEETLAAGEVVVPEGEPQNGYRSVRLPLGVLGYVHGRFAEVGDDGTVTSKGARVAFRYRPNAREAPVRFVDDGTPFQLVALDGEWIKVRYADQAAWVPETSIVVFPAGEAVDTVVAAWRSHDERQRQQVAEAAARLRESRALATELAALSERVAAEWERLRAEVAKDSREQDLAPLRATAEDLAQQAPEGSDARAEVERLIVAIDQQARAIEMQRILDAKAPPPEVTVEVRRADPDPLGDYATGWLRASGGLFSERRFSLEKGGQVLFELECTTGRYTLDLFEGMEVAVRGPADRPDAESMRRLDVQRIEVLARARR